MASEIRVADAPYSDIDLAPPAVEREALPGGGWRLWNPNPLQPYPDHLIECLRKRAAEAPDKTFLAQRDGAGGWRELTFGEAARQSANIAQALIDRRHGPDRPLAILSDNSIEFGLIELGAMHVGIPVLPISSAYSLMSTDHEKLRTVVAHHEPSVIYVDDAGPFARALASLEEAQFELITNVPSEGATPLADLIAVEATAEVEERLAQIGPDTIAKILLTSGSTGQPKGVINTQRMMCANQAMKAQTWPFLRERPPVIIDWLPWNHTFGGNYCFNLALYAGGTFYIDEGRPAPGRFQATLDNLREISPTVYLNVPRGFDVLVPELEADDALRDNLFRNLDALFFAGAALPQSTRERLEALSVAARGIRLPILTSLGATETGPAGTYLTWDSPVWGNVGVPLPGAEMKLIPNGDKLEAWFRGPHVTPGYYKEPELTANAFDDEGFFSIGDAVKFLDPDDPAKGLIFDGRVAENFKLSSGTWVAAGTLRLAAISAGAPVIQDAVVTGHDRNELGLLAFPNPAGCRALCPDAPDDEPLDRLIERREIKARLKEGLAGHNRANPASSTRITRVLMMAEPAAIDAGEITDKGYINQRAVLARRADLVERLYAEPAGDDVVIVG
jgi:feruloyl-CoA synthase